MLMDQMHCVNETLSIVGFLFFFGMIKNSMNFDDFEGAARVGHVGLAVGLKLIVLEKKWNL